MQLQTTRFGNIEVDDEQIVTFRDGLPGFEDNRRFVLLEHPGARSGPGGSPFRWLHCADTSPGAESLAFPVISPWQLDPDYAPTVPGPALRELGIADVRRQVQMWAIVTIPVNQPERATANLLAPVLINRESRQARQVVLLDDDLQLRRPLQEAGGSRAEGASAAARETGGVRQAKSLAS